MPDGPLIITTCPRCGMNVESDRSMRRADGSYRRGHCYFKETYLEGLVRRRSTQP